MATFPHPDQSTVTLLSRVIGPIVGFKLQARRCDWRWRKSSKASEWARTFAVIVDEHAHAWLETNREELLAGRHSHLPELCNRFKSRNAETQNMEGSAGRGTWNQSVKRLTWLAIRLQYIQRANLETWWHFCFGSFHHKRLLHYFMISLKVHVVHFLHVIRSSYSAE